MKARLPKQNMGGAQNMNAMIRQAQKMQDEITTLQEDIENREFSATSGGGAVSVVVTGKKIIKSLTINKEVVDPEDVEMLEDLIMAAANEALRKMDEVSQSSMAKITGGLGGGFGFVVVARILGFLLTRYPDPSVCLFVGLIGGMLPSLFREAGKKGRKKSDLLMTVVCFGMILILLTLLQIIQVTIAPSFGWYLFCGFCIALSVIAPGMSFSTLLMPLGLYTPLVDGIGRLDMAVLIPAGIGALLTVLLLARAVTVLMEHHYAMVFHGIVSFVLN